MGELGLSMGWSSLWESFPTLPLPCLSLGTSGVRLEQTWLTAYSTAARRTRCLLGPVRRKQVSKWGKAEAPSLLLVHGTHFTACAQSPSRRRFLCACCRSVVSNFATPWTVARQAPLSMGFPRQEYWSGLPFLLQGIFPTQGLNPCLLYCKQILYCWATGGKLKAVQQDASAVLIISATFQASLLAWRYFTAMVIPQTTSPPPTTF